MSPTAAAAAAVPTAGGDAARPRPDLRGSRVALCVALLPLTVVGGVLLAPLARLAGEPVRGSAADGGRVVLQRPLYREALRRVDTWHQSALQDRGEGVRLTASEVRYLRRLLEEAGSSAPAAVASAQP